jgi:hypothetical protein
VGLIWTPAGGPNFAPRGLPGPSFSGGFYVSAGPSASFAYWYDDFQSLPAVPPFSFLTRFTLTRAAAGTYQIGIAGLSSGQNARPQLVGAPKAFLHCAGGPHSYSIVAQYSGSPISGVNVWTTEDGVLTDLDFSVDLF